MTNIAIFLLLSVVIVWVSWPSIKSPRSYGFPRFFAFEAVLALVILNVNYWFVEPFSLRQIISWICLLISLFLIIYGIYLLRNVGRPSGSIENTTQLVLVGAYRYIRHPMYSSLLFLGWGSFFKAPSWVGCALVLVATASLILTAKMEEWENLHKFGDAYAQYLNETKMFVPFVF